ncbi:hypothetical protein [Paenibacillus sp. AR247]|uniref:hypothetical protein n=1 Tax=Paenibacillus sp. AR247 TaxID=1631599 RepID=UPI0021585D30|nr:hypothetical protein [Paenibacillus sp. AR247]
MRESLGDRAFGVINVIALGLISLITFFPFYYVFVVSFTDPSEYIRRGLVLFPQHWSLVSYKYLLSTDAFMRAIGNSAFLAIVGTALSLIVTSGLSYAISRRRLQGRRFIMLAILLTPISASGTGSSCRCRFPPWRRSACSMPLRTGTPFSLRYCILTISRSIRCRCCCRTC